jgi:hypothetical protein
MRSVTRQQQPSGPERPKGQGIDHCSGHIATAIVVIPHKELFARWEGHPHPANPHLGADASVERRDRLLTEFSDLAGRRCGAGALLTRTLEN